MFATGSEIFIGWATLLLAVFTAGVAAVTSRAVHWTRKAAEATEDLARHAAKETDAAQRQVAATVKLGEASVRPWITTDPTNTLTISPDLGEGTSAPSVSLRVRNVGAGLALVVPQQTYMREYEPLQAQPPSLQRGMVAAPAIPPIGELAQTDPWQGAAPVIFNLADRHLHGPTLKDLLAEPPPRDVPFLIDLKYTDAVGEQPIWARFHCVRRADRSALVTSTDYLLDENGMPSIPPWISTESHLG